MIPQIVTVSLAAAADNNVCASQAVAGAGNLTINGSAASGGVATLDKQRRLIVTSSGNDSGITFTITGTRKDGGVISEVVAGANTTVSAQTVQDFLTVTQVAASGAAAANVKVGTNGVGSSAWQALSQHSNPAMVSFGCVATGTINYDVEYTYDNPNGPLGTFPPAPVVPTTWKHPSLQNQTGNAEDKIDYPVWGWRVLVNSGSGSVTVTGTQTGMRS